MTSEHKTKVLNNGQTGIIGEAFGLQDSKGREIGGYAVCGWVEYAPLTAEDMAPKYGYSCYSRAPGIYYTARVQPTRDGQSFGASQELRHFNTEVERNTYVAKAMAASSKRYAAKVAKGQV